MNGSAPGPRPASSSLRGDELRFEDRSVLVTGAARGLGQAYARMLAGRGAQVMVADRGTELLGTGSNASLARDTATQIVRDGGTAEAYVGDLATEHGARGAVRATVEAFGGIDVLVHNAGFTLGGCAFEHESLDRLDALLAINTRAAYSLAQECWPAMVKRGRGRMILTSSTALYGMANSIPYATAKASLVGLTRALAEEGRPHDIAVNMIEPAGATRMAENLEASEFRTWFLDTMRPGLVAPLVTYLAHDECAITGEMLVVGGGRVARTVLAETTGYVNNQMTAEDVRDQMSSVLAQRDFHFPRNTAESGAIAASALGYTFADPIGLAASAHQSPVTSEVSP